MSRINQILEDNRRAAAPRVAADQQRPTRRMVILTCMDCRLNPCEFLALETGEAHVIRNAGAIVTDDVISSLVLSHHMLGTRELMIIGHTDCGVLGLDENELLQRLRQGTGYSPPEPMGFCSFADLNKCVRRQVAIVRSHPWLAELKARGFIYDVETGLLTEVQA